MKLRIGTTARVKETIQRWDWLLLIGLCPAPMTGLRIWRMGPTEVL